MKPIKVICAATLALTTASVFLPARSQILPKPSQSTETFGAWTVRCIGDEEKACEAVQVINGQAGTIAEIAIALTENQDEAIIASRAPLGVLVSEPILFGETGSSEIIEIDYVTCLSQGCFAQVSVPAEGLLSLADKKSGHLSIKERTGRTYKITVSFEGLRSALTRLGAG